MTQVLVVAPHMDDEVLGVGGTIARHVAEGDIVDVCIIAHRVYDHKFDDEKNQFEMTCTRSAKEILGYRETTFLGLQDERLDISLQDILIPLEQEIRRLEPEIVYLPHRGDLNQDHRAVFQAAMIALRPQVNPNVMCILSYEVPSSTDQAPPFPEYAFLPNCYTNIEGFLGIKIKALKCYKTEKRHFPNPRSTEGIVTVARKRGTESGLHAAEAFIVVRNIWR